MIWRLALAGLLVGHAVIHTGFVSPRPAANPGGPPWPFELSRSWLLGSLGVAPDLARLLGTGLVLLTVAGLALAALTTIGVVPVGLWLPAIAVGAVASLALLVLFFHPWLVLGVAIDAVLLWAAFGAGWSPARLTG